MGIKSTVRISRESAISRIKDVCACVIVQDYLGLESICFEPEENLESFINVGVGFDMSNIETWTNGMIKDVLDKPFFRYSMFDNYLVVS